ncbi:MAG: acyl-CoA dehydrogenase family protein [bacterium]|nr:acyl-CoA dehydrogenase family protein [bacterium]
MMWGLHEPVADGFCDIIHHVMALGEGLRVFQGEKTSRFDRLPSSPAHWNNFLSKDVPVINNSSEVVRLSTPEFLAHINNLAVEVIKSPNYRDSKSGYISDAAWKRLVDGGLLFSPLGERDLNRRQEEIMQTGRILSYYDLSLGLTYGIMSALVIMPLQRFGSEKQREKYLGKIRKGERMGLAITELNMSGSTALIMRSNFTVDKDSGTVDLEFEKQFQGLSGKAGLIVVANKNGRAGRPGLFVVDQEDIETEITPMAGLSGIPYGINKCKKTFNLEDHLMTLLSLRDFQDIFTKSRFLFVGMTLGHQERVESEANSLAAEKIIGGVPQGQMDVPRNVLNKIKTRRIISEAIFNRIARYRKEGKSLLDIDTNDLVVEASAVKSLPAEYAFISAERAGVLAGGGSYYLNSALQNLNDIWPFRIFEGAEPMLYTQIGHDFSKGKFTANNKAENLFDSSMMVQNLESVTETCLSAMNSKNITKVHEELMGQIACRLFALGCLSQNDIDLREFKRAKTMLNLEIRKLTEDYRSVEEIS